MFRLSTAELEQMKQCANKLRLLAETDEDLNILSTSKKRKYFVEKLTPESYDKQYGEPEMSRIAFAPRCLIEGLMAHGILRPGDVPALVETLNQQASHIGTKCRILESLYNEERIRDVRKCVGGKLAVDRVDASNRADIAKLAGKARFLRRNPPPALEHLVMIRTIQVTPTRVLVNPPQQEASNSVTRRYQDKLDAIIRVQFTDEEDRLFVSFLPRDPRRLS